MKRIIGSLAFVLLVILISVCQHEKARVLIIGDSISIGYTPFVQENLQDIAEVFHNPGNAKHTGYGLDSIESWIGDNEWDIIHFNWGLWDLCYRHPDSRVQGKRDKVNGEITYDIDDYSRNLDSIVSLMRRETEAELVFLSTTYVPENEAGRHMEDAIKYNNVAIRIMESNNVIINDIYNRSRVIHNEFGKGPDDVHYYPEGYRELGMEISKFLKHEIKHLSRRNHRN